MNHVVEVIGDAIGGSLVAIRFIAAGLHDEVGDVQPEAGVAELGLLVQE